MNAATCKAASAWFDRLAKLCQDDASRLGIYRTAAKLSDGVWAITNGNYAVLSAPPAGLEGWDRTIPADPNHGWPLAELAILAAGGDLPEWSEGKIGTVRQNESKFPQIDRVLSMVCEDGHPAPRRRMPDMTAILAAVDAEVARQTAEAKPSTAVQLAAAKNGIKIPHGCSIPTGAFLAVWAVDDDPAVRWSIQADLQKWTLDKDGVPVREASTITIGNPGDKKGAWKLYSLKYLRRLAKSGAWQGGWMYDDEASASDMYFGRDFAMIMPVRKG